MTIQDLSDAKLQQLRKICNERRLNYTKIMDGMKMCKNAPPLGDEKEHLWNKAFSEGLKIGLELNPCQTSNSSSG